MTTVPCSSAKGAGVSRAPRAPRVAWFSGHVTNILPTGRQLFVAGSEEVLPRLNSPGV